MASDPVAGLAAVLAQLAVGASLGTRLAAEHVLQVSRTRVPIEEGTLERSGKVTAEEREGRVLAVVSYGGGVGVSVGGATATVGAAAYALTQHEDMTLRHDSGRSAKYLESAATGEADVVRRIQAQALRDALGLGG